MTNKKTKEPLLYIEQPSFDKPVVFMQDNYSSLLKDKSDAKPEVREEKRIQKRRHKSNPFLEVLKNGPIENEEDEFELDELDDDIDELENEKEEQGVEVKSNNNETFNDLTIQGKIDYFTNLPAEMPKIKSEVVLDKDVYRGYILEDQGKEIVIRVGRMEEVVNKADINDIVLIGF